MSSKRWNHPLYSKYTHMILRCYNPKSNRYYRYGARGITVCDEWLESIDNFIEWAESIGYEPNRGLQIDRIDNDGNYEPSNCRFVSIKENCDVGRRNKQANSTTGYTGVSFEKESGKYVAHIRLDRKLKKIGRFKDKEDAVRARVKFEIEYYGEQRTNLDVKIIIEGD